MSFYYKYVHNQKCCFPVSEKALVAFVILSSGSGLECKWQCGLEINPPVITKPGV